MADKKLEKRLSTAYDAGYFDGYSEGIEHTHELWMRVLPTVPHIGIKRLAAIMKAVYEHQQERSELSKLVRDSEHPDSSIQA